MEDRDKNDILDELLEQAQSSRNGFDEEVDDVNFDTDDTRSSSSLLDHLLNKAMKEKVSRESDSFNPEAIYQDQEIPPSNFDLNLNEEDANQKSRFKYLFFEILTPDEYNDIIYLGEDLLKPMEQSVAGLDNNGHDTHDTTDIGQSSSKESIKEDTMTIKNQYESHLLSQHDNVQPPVDNPKVDARRTKMESLLKRMTDRYKVRSKEISNDSKEEVKTQKLKTMIDILEDKLHKYDDDKKNVKEKGISSRRIDPGSSYLDKLAERGIQSRRTTPSSSYYQSKNKYATTTTKPRKDQEQIKEKWNQAMDELADKLSKKSSGVHRINLDEMLDLDMLEVPESDQKSSDSYPGTTAVPPSDYYNKPKRQIHPKLTFQRHDFGDVHRPSSKLKDLIREKEELNRVTSENVIKSLPPISRYHDQEPVYQPTTVARPDECPYIPKRPYTECYNAPPSECHEVGYPDPSCSPGSLCCYDGCINLCWRNPNYPPKLPPLPPPPAEYVLHSSTPTPTPPPKVYSYTLEPHVTTTLPPPTTPGYVLADTYRSTPQPPKLDYIPPLGNDDALHHPQAFVHLGHHKESKAIHQPHAVTPYPPPSTYYKQPSISFVAKGEIGGASYSTMAPPTKEYYKEAKALDHSAHMQQYLPPSKDYLPPSKPMEEHMSTYQPPSKDYLPPVHHSTPVPVHHSTPAPAHMSSYSPPSKAYIPPSPSSTIKPPSTSYLPPHSTTKPTYKDVLTKGYIPPANLVHAAKHKGTPQSYHMSTTYAPPSKEYLPPHQSTYAPPNKAPTPRPDHHLNLPSKDYLPPPQEYHMDHMVPPETNYGPPEHMSHIIPPEKKYLPPEHMSHISPPKKQYLPPPKEYHMDHMVPPETNYGPPEHMSHIVPPEKQYLPPKHVSHMTPPEKNYLPPEHMSHITPPGKQYIPPEHVSHMTPPEKQYLPPNHVSHKAPPDYMSHMSPPGKEYIPPDHMSYMAPPEKSYIPPDTMSHMHPPGKDYHPPEHMYKMHPPEKNYIPPHHMSHLVPPEEPVYAVCPHFTLKEKTDCPKISHQCWSPGVPDEDCPYHGLCCFDGCNNICLDPSHHPGKGFHIPKHNAYLVPGHKYVPSPGHEEHHKKFTHRTLLAPSKEYLPPTESVYHLVEGPEEYEPELPNSYLPPAKEYLPPAKEYLPPSKIHYDEPVINHELKEKLPSHPKSITGYEVPKHEYLPPPPTPSVVKDEKHPYASYLPPSKDYLPPPSHHEEIHHPEYEVSTPEGEYI